MSPNVLLLSPRLQAVMKTPSKFGYSMSALIDQDLIDKLEEDRIETLKWCESKLKNPKRSVCKPEPWEGLLMDNTRSSSHGIRSRRQWLH